MSLNQNTLEADRMITLGNILGCSILTETSQLASLREHNLTQQFLLLLLLLTWIRVVNSTCTSESSVASNKLPTEGAIGV